MAQANDYRIAVRLSEELYNEIDKTIDLLNEKTKIKVNKTTIITSALEEGLKVLQEQLSSEK